MMKMHLTANVPIALSECLTPSDLGEVLAAAEEERSSPEDFMVAAVKERLMRRRLALETAKAEPVAA